MDLAPRSPTHRLFGVEEFEVDAATEFLTDRVRHLARWWFGADGGRVPLKSRFDIVDHPEIIAHVFLVERLGDGSFQFRLHGEAVAELVGRHNTHNTHMPVTAHSTAAFGQVLSAYYAGIAAKRRPRRCIGRLVFAEREWRRFESVDCPLSSDGRNVDFIIGVMDLLPGRIGDPIPQVR